MLFSLKETFYVCACVWSTRPTIMRAALQRLTSWLLSYGTSIFTYFSRAEFGFLLWVYCKGAWVIFCAGIDIMGIR